MSKREQKKHLKEVKRRKLIKEKSVRQELVAHVPPREIRNVLLVSHQLMDDRRFAEAEELLTKERERRPNSPEILEALIELYQQTRDHQSLAELAPRLVRLQPRDPEAFLIMAQSYLFCGRLAIALETYRQFLTRWPGHEHKSKAMAAIGLLEPEVAKILPKFDLSESELDLLAMHDQVLLDISAGDFESAICHATDLLKIKPRMVSPRNNLALALFQTGQLSLAIRVNRETLDLFPDNRFAEAALGKVLFLTGELDDAALIADRISQSPAEVEDAIVAQAELMSLLGRDEDVIRLADFMGSFIEKSPDRIGIMQHYKAVALMRLGREKDAPASWKLCLKNFPNFPPARQNLEELKSKENCHAPWAEPFGKWIPQGLKEEFVAFLSSPKSGSDSKILSALKKWPHLRKLVPALLDRGDRGGREFAMLLAKADGAPDMLDALKDFATGQRGPDSMRASALMFIREKGHIGNEPIRFWSKGAWTEVASYCSEIDFEPVPHANPEVTDLVSDGILAMRRDDLQTAERTFRQCIELDPDYPTAWHNLAAVLLLRKNKADNEKGRRILHELFDRFPDYVFARISLAQLAIQDGRIEDAKELIAPLVGRTRWQASEAMAHGAVNVELALAMKDYRAAEVSLNIMRQLDEDDPRIEQLRRRIDLSQNPLAVIGSLIPKIARFMKR
jgi:tetratricopeptide (TPR) repeat protein